MLLLWFSFCEGSVGKGTSKAYVRGLGRAVLCLAHPFFAIPYVYDVRGDIEDETMAASGSRVKQKIYSMLARFGLTEPVTLQPSVQSWLHTSQGSL